MQVSIPPNFQPHVQPQDYRAETTASRTYRRTTLRRLPQRGYRSVPVNHKCSGSSIVAVQPELLIAYRFIGIHDTRHRSERTDECTPLKDAFDICQKGFGVSLEMITWNCSEN
ncbi:hypothetical protein CBL_08298 [Carabus blaptoides fortunei]